MGSRQKFAAEHEKEIHELFEQAIPTLQAESIDAVLWKGGGCCAADLDLTRPPTWLDTKLEWEREHSYRRGYFDGYSRAMDDLRDSCKPSRWQVVANFFDTTLQRWFYGMVTEKGVVNRAIPPSAPRGGK